MSKESFEQHSVYLGMLLRKHKFKSGISHEDLESSWSRLEAHCKKNSQTILVSI